MYTFEYTLDEKDYLEFNKFHHMNSAETKKITKPTNLLFAAIGFVGWILLMFFEIPETLAFLGILLGFLTAFCVVVFSLILLWKPLIMLLVRISIKSMKKQGKLPFGKVNIIHFSEEDIHQIAEISETKVKYDIIEKIDVGDKAIYIYFTAAQAFLVPYSAFENEQQTIDFLSFIKEKVPGKPMTN